MILLTHHQDAHVSAPKQSAIQKILNARAGPRHIYDKCRYHVDVYSSKEKQYRIKDVAYLDKLALKLDIIDPIANQG